MPLVGPLATVDPVVVVALLSHSTVEKANLQINVHKLEIFEKYGILLC